MRFPPLGDRGIDGAGLDSDFHLRGGEGYTDRANAETFLIVQIETLQAVENVEAIAAIDGINGLFVGPGDLGLRIKNAGGNLTLDDAMAKVAAVARQSGKAWGCPAATVERMQELHAQGATLLAHGGDFMAMMNMLRDSAADFDTTLGG